MDDDAVRRMLADFSIEVTPRETAALDEAAALLPPGTRVYVTDLPGVDLARSLDAATRVREHGLRPVVHVAVRSIPDLAALDRTLGAVADAGVEDLLLIAGSRPPAGAFENTLQVLESEVLARRPFASIGVAGHPEGNPGVDEGAVDHALARKDKLARDGGLPLHVVTQFGFAADPVLGWERRMREAGIALPVRVGLPGLTSPARLLRFGLSCGVGPSLAVLRKQTGSVLKLATQVYRPTETLLGLARAVSADPESLISAVHFFPFGAVVPTARWATTGQKDGLGAETA
ncbi:methylenetetrahydrofolate reductase [Actinomycetospora rhizophila]|uniref:Methylenetetrahydrofolate reductase n=1 Tax=Actinomycetospora rhizophila TaxID=1416876 RepID=A0ABV9ZNN4_9PSEU